MNPIEIIHHIFESEDPTPPDALTPEDRAALGIIGICGIFLAVVVVALFCKYLVP